jgi:bifunctional non-homologous end joining protein LigD
VIGGYTKPTGARVGFGALLLGHYAGGQLMYSGKVGTGFTNDSLRQLAAELRKRRTDRSPFAKPPTGAEARSVIWVKPELVGEVEFTEWTADGALRHPSFQGLRADKDPRQIVREQPKSLGNQPDSAFTMSSPARTQSKRPKARPSSRRRTAPRSTSGNSAGESPTIAGVTITHPDRIVYPEQGFTKLDVAKYYETVADYILPHLAGRPLSLVRCPAGASGQCFYQKHVTESTPDAVHSVAVKEKGHAAKYVMIDDLAGLISLVQIGVLELHPWPATKESLESPDRMIFDLDPGPGVSWKDVIAAARDVRSELEARRLKSYVRTSGGKGLHVVVPLAPVHTWDEVKEFAHDVSLNLVNQQPNRYVATMTKSKRGGKVFIDYFRNGRGATAVASYSTRARAGAPVALPLRWEELGRTKSADQFNVVNTLRRLKSQKQDAWKEFFRIRQSLS